MFDFLKKLLISMIPIKKYRKKYRKRLLENIEQKKIDYINSEKGKKKLSKLKKKYPEVMTTKETIQMILDKKLSIARYGDGELNMILNKKKSGVPFQKKDKELEKRLIEILKNNFLNKVLVCIPIFSYENEKNYQEIIKKEPKKFLERYWLNHEKVMKMFNLESRYGNAFVSRSHTFYDNNLELIKKIWDKREVVFVYGKNGRFKEDERLFGNIKSSENILIPPINAFDSYNEIFKKCLKKSKNKLFLIAAGPTATVLAYDLAIQGYQALDIGHLPNSYHEFLGEIISPELLPKENKESSH